MPVYDIVDSQIHLFRTMRTDEALASMDSLGIQGALLDEVWGYREGDARPMPYVPLPELGGLPRPVAPGAQMASMLHPDRFRYLLRVNHRDPEVEAVIRLAAADPHCRALRLDVRNDDEIRDFSGGLYRVIFKAAARHSLTVFVLARENAPLLEPYLAEFTSVPIGIDHVGLSPSPGGYGKVLALGRFPNAILKWSHAHRTFASLYPFEPAIQGLRRAIDAFGQERIMWGSDFTATIGVHRWIDCLTYVRDSAELTVEEKTWILGRTARTVLDWSPPAALHTPAPMIWKPT